MNEMTLKEKAALAVVGVAVVYAITVILWFTTIEGSWKKAVRKYKDETAKFEREERLIAEKGRWNSAYEEEKSSMPSFAIDKNTDTTWRRIVEDLARTNRVQITKINTGEEVKADDVKELPLYGDYEASLVALVKFMYALEATTDGMFDVSEISVKPGSKKGYLKGTISLTCAYMRDEEQ